MEPSQEPLSTSTETKTETSLLTEKSKRRTNKRHDWIELKADYLSGTISDICDWARAKGISENTAYKNTNGWQAEYQERHRDLVGKALERSGRKYVSALETRLRAGRVLVSRAMRGLTKAKINKAEARDLAAIIKIGSDIQGSVYEATKPETQVNVQVNNGSHLDPTTAEALRQWVKHHASNAGTSQSILVGNPENQAG